MNKACAIICVGLIALAVILTIEKYVAGAIAIVQWLTS